MHRKSAVSSAEFGLWKQYFNFVRFKRKLHPLTSPVLLSHTMRRILRLDQTFLFSLSIINLKSNYVPKILDFCPFTPYFFKNCTDPWLHHIPFKALKVKENAWKGFMLLNLFKRFNANPVYNFIIGILFFALFFLNSNLISFLYSQLGKQCICTHKMHFCLLGISPKPSESIWNLIELHPTFYILL